jgi:hypothetical protein
MGANVRAGQLRFVVHEQHLTLASVIGVLPFVFERLEGSLEVAVAAAMVALPQLVSEVAAQGHKCVQNQRIANGPAGKDGKEHQREHPRPATPFWPDLTGRPTWDGNQRQQKRRVHQHGQPAISSRSGPQTYARLACQA